MVISAGLKVASDRYERLREIARETTKESLCAVYSDWSKFALTAIDNNALKESSTWADMSCSRPRAEWSWRSSTSPTALPTCWTAPKLPAGRESKGSKGKLSIANARMRIELIEAAPRVGNPLGPRRVVPITIMGATAYAGIVGAKELRIMRPANALIGYYESLGFVYVESSGAKNYPAYLYRVLR